MTQSTFTKNEKRSPHTCAKTTIKNLFQQSQPLSNIEQRIYTYATLGYVVKQNGE